MKKVLFVATLFAATTLTSCGSGDKTNNDKSPSTSTTASPSTESTTSTDTKKEESSSSEATTSSSSKNWDNVLSDYEKYVDDYVVLYKKAMKGDATAMQEYPAIMQKAQDLQKSLDDAKNDKGFTASHASKMMKIQQKMLDAVK